MTSVGLRTAYVEMSENNADRFDVNIPDKFRSSINSISQNIKYKINF
jgi:hypothetical protein